MGSDEFHMLLYVLCTTHGYRASLSLDTIGRPSAHESTHLFPGSRVLYIGSQVRLCGIPRLHNIGRSGIIHPTANGGHNAFRSASFHGFIDRRHDWRFQDNWCGRTVEEARGSRPLYVFQIMTVDQRLRQSWISECDSRHDSEQLMYDQDELGSDDASCFNRHSALR
ncbi:hypothetical protein AG1IA_09953 [Rhizoctonia solani AG-1 IA]|uniref:Uncharacterized protein n=1 Tax=Thanatephorus cucumeris (strain AG1-IA) TaxID=983506 RepID=L8WH09_THACA|nr:hypothetical protein AG1IA_09953 [Rhizoctonia solani AG-1 IA]